MIAKEESESSVVSEDFEKAKDQRSAKSKKLIEKEQKQKEQKQFLGIIREIFQFESSDLDFGIYRIFNYKRKRIEEFIEEELPDKIKSTFA
ncbi:MAG: hypothetical protein ACP5OZ_04105, partial [Candidatus Woesearchaeota archaeon]